MKVHWRTFHAEWKPWVSKKDFSVLSTGPTRCLYYHCWQSLCTLCRLGEWGERGNGLWCGWLRECSFSLAPTHVSTTEVSQYFRTDHIPNWSRYQIAIRDQGYFENRGYLTKHLFTLKRSTRWGKGFTSTAKNTPYCRKLRYPSFCRKYYRVGHGW